MLHRKSYYIANGNVTKHLIGSLEWLIVEIVRIHQNLKVGIAQVLGIEVYIVLEMAAPLVLRFAAR